MDGFFSIALILTTLAGRAGDHQNEPDSTCKQVIKSRATLFSAGFTPVPSLFVDGPVVSGNVSLKTGRFINESDVTIGLSGKGAFASNWTRYTLRKQEKWELQLGLNVSMLSTIQRVHITDKNVHVSHIGIAEARSTLKLSRTVSFISSLQWMEVYRTPRLRGAAINVSVLLEPFQKSKHISLIWQPQVFYFNFEGGFDGVLIPNVIIFGKKQSGLKLMGLTLAPLSPGFRFKNIIWMGGFTYSFNCTKNKKQWKNSSF
jgi:hypothetical protein